MAHASKMDYQKVRELQRITDNINKQIKELKEMKEDMILDYWFTKYSFKWHKNYVKEVIIWELFWHADVEYINKMNKWLEVLYPVKYNLNR